jgi:carbon monoxide dehydrogenase subunit G
MEIKNEFTVGVPIDEAWAVFTDLAGIATCLPGAQLTGQEGDTYFGKVKVKVGPVVSEFAGTAVFTEKDDEGYRAVIEAQGRDSRGSGNASATITASLRPDGVRTVVSVDTDLSISGKVAQFGKSAIVEISQKLMGQFVECLEAKLMTRQATSQNATSSDETSAPSSPTSAESVPLPEPEALDLLSVAGGTLYKRLIPVAVVIVAVVVYFIVR